MPEILAQPQTAAEISFLIPYYRSLPVYANFITINQRLSMLHPDALTILYHLAGNVSGEILEVGPCIGGSTVAMSKGLDDNSREACIVTVEKGGVYEHPTHGSEDVISDLKRNLNDWSANHHTHLVEGGSRDPAVVAQVHKLLAGKSLGLLFMDADGLVDQDFATYGDLILPGTYLVVDDYFTGGAWPAHDKAASTKQMLDDMERSGVLECFGIYGWGTWVGRMK